MIIVALGENEKQFTLVMRGHAGYDEPGKDIVCSAASILVYTLIENIGADRLSGWVEEGDVMLRCRCSEDSQERMALKVISRGLKLLAEKNRQYMFMSEHRLDEDGEPVPEP